MSHRRKCHLVVLSLCLLPVVIWVGHAAIRAQLELNAMKNAVREGRYESNAPAAEVREAIHQASSISGISQFLRSPFRTDVRFFFGPGRCAIHYASRIGKEKWFMKLSI